MIFLPKCAQCLKHIRHFLIILKQYALQYWNNCYTSLRKRPVSMYKKTGKETPEFLMPTILSNAFLTYNGFDGFLPEFGDVIVLQEKLFQASELSESSRGHPFNVAMWQVEAHQLWNHFKGIGFHFLERIALQMQRTQVGNVWNGKIKLEVRLMYLVLNTWWRYTWIHDCKWPHCRILWKIWTVSKPEWNESILDFCS